MNNTTKTVRNIEIRVALSFFSVNFKFWNLKTNFSADSVILAFKTLTYHKTSGRLDIK